ncbi:jg8396 [Pararge aegeria aegeria]|uniref:Jg8396 protein n=1 Tax=Pararge aegeria aegeria TaxID=348720 RepID=A0A8S4SML3_9NEOP|nr:jg8396 [Pararge aegeria aegeria]
MWYTNKGYKEIKTHRQRYDHTLEFIPTNRGKGMMLIYKGYTYAHMTHNTRWYCSKKAAGCKARLVTTSEGQLVEVLENVLEFVPSSRGKGTTLIYRGYTYAHMKSKTRWYCSKKAAGCKARVITSDEDWNGIQFIPSNRGSGYLLLYMGNTFVNMYKNMRWHCSKRHSGCKVRMSTTAGGKFAGATGEHNHPPPQIFRTADGKIMKL